MSEQKFSDKLQKLGHQESDELFAVYNEAEYNELLADATALEDKLEAMELLLEECRKAISNVPDKAVFGIGGDGLTHWYLADELLSDIVAAQQEQEWNDIEDDWKNDAAGG